MVSNLRDAIVETMNTHLNRVLRAAEIGIPGKEQYQAFRSFALDEFGRQGFLPELESLLKQQGKERNGLAETAGKGVPP
ncbi:conserved protein of unknown function [Georgfuchsia toluolica]|uniref:Uncharacterized protein n=1 Tax=Georgfuchsia toluolica TaxID=424218 RepID=A0A916N239_9PROT|nr:hypothetical protein [Georgfuchsia toluolica]CAG4883404.1 conserved protein of unknown function [Georgfuchsia toluolica]